MSIFVSPSILLATALTPPALSRRCILSGSAVAFVGQLRATPPASATAGKLLEATGTTLKRPVATEVQATQELNEAEQKLSALLTKSVADREAVLGFKLDADDILDIEDILRNKYCGKQGMFSSLPGGTCAESRPTVTCFNKPSPLGAPKQVATVNSLGAGLSLGDKTGSKGCYR